MGSGWLKRLFSSDRRREERRRLPGLVAHYWDGASPRAREVVDISATGSYLQTDERWYPGTVFRVMLQASKSGDAEPEYEELERTEATAGGAGSGMSGATSGREETQALAVLAEMVRHGPDGVGLRFIFPEDADPETLRKFPNCRTDRKALTQFLKRAEDDHSAVSFSID